MWTASVTALGSGSNSSWGCGSERFKPSRGRAWISIAESSWRKEGLIRGYPKGRKHHSHRVPQELWDRLKQAKAASASEFVVTSPMGGRIGTHGLRHSTS